MKSFSKSIKITFSDHFNISKKALVSEGLFNISLVSDLPIFIDPFRLFYSNKKSYHTLHNEIIKYLVFLKELSIRNNGRLSTSIINTYYRFPEIKQNWFGFSFLTNKGHGLGFVFARALNNNFAEIFKDFGIPTKTRHLEKLTLVADRVGKDCISDFTTNLIVGFLAEQTEKFGKKHLPQNRTKKFTILKASFDYEREVWIPKSYILPFHKNDYVLLTPRDILTKGETWINKNDFIENFDDIPSAAPNDILRLQLSNFLQKQIVEFAETKVNKKTGKSYLSITKQTKRKAVISTIKQFPETIDIYIKIKESKGNEGISNSELLVNETEDILENQYRNFVQIVGNTKTIPTTYDESRTRALYFKHCIEKRDGYLNLYIGDIPVDEEWIQRMFWFVWCGSGSDVNRDPNNGLGLPDFAISKGKIDKTLIEFKLAKSSSFEKNILIQLETYKDVDDVRHGVWVIVYFTKAEHLKITKVLEKHNLIDNSDYILVDARKDNKTPVSKRK